MKTYIIISTLVYHKKKISLREKYLPSLRISHTLRKLTLCFSLTATDQIYIRLEGERNT